MPPDPKERPRNDATLLSAATAVVAPSFGRCSARGGRSRQSRGRRRRRRRHVRTCAGSFGFPRTELGTCACGVLTSRLRSCRGPRGGWSTEPVASPSVISRRSTMPSSRQASSVGVASSVSTYSFSMLTVQLHLLPLWSRASGTGRLVFRRPP